MVLELLINGIKQYSAGTNQEGAIVAILAAQESEKKEDSSIYVNVKSIAKADGMSVWPSIRLNIGDEVTIRILSEGTADLPSETYPVSSSTHTVIPDSR